MKNFIAETKRNILYSGSRIYLFIAINVAVFLTIGLTGGFEFLFSAQTGIAEWLRTMVSVPAYLPKLGMRFWTLFTYMFSHTGLFHIFFNMLWLYWFGRIFETFLSTRQFVFTYLAGGLAGAILYIVFYNVFPAYRDVLPYATLIGASASVMAIGVAAATLVPNYKIFLLIIGEVKLKWIVLVYIVIDILGIAQPNSGGSLSHLGGALFGFIFIKQLQKGSDWSKLFKKRSKLKIVKNQSTSRANQQSKPEADQEVIDRILDKISKSGYDSLSKAEQDQLFNASKK